MGGRGADRVNGGVQPFSKPRRALVVRPPRERPIVAASASSAPVASREPSRWRCRLGRTRSPTCRPWCEKAFPTRQRAASGETAHEHRSTCRTRPTDCANALHCGPLTKSRSRTAVVYPAAATRPSSARKMALNPFPLLACLRKAKLLRQPGIRAVSDQSASYPALAK